jgi:diguanylate cyclase (GGDEF)-like protein/PAS domain S-box-containing protein
MFTTARPLPLRRLASLQAGVLLGAACLLGLLALAVTLTLRHEHHREIDSILQEGERTAQKLAFRTAEVFDRVNQSTLLVKHLSNARRLPPLQSLRHGGVLANDVTRAVFVVDRIGTVVDSTSDLVALNIGDEDYFKAHKRQADLDLTIGTVEPQPLTQGWAIPVSRRLDSHSGDFAGLIVAAVDPSALAAAGYARTEAIDTAIGVVGRDGIYRSRIINGKVSFGEKVDVARLERRATDAQLQRRPLTSPIDGVERFVAVVSVPRYPLLAVVAVKADTALAGYRHARQRILSWAAPLGLLIVAGGLLLWHKLGQLQQSRLQTRRTEAAFRATIEGSLDAVCLMRAQRDATGTLIDMNIIDCNARAAATVGLSRGEVIGQSLCTLTPSLRSFLPRFETAIQTGQPSHTEVQADEPRILGRWLHHQVVPLEDGVALISRDVTERKDIERTLASLARLDTLTQLGNRRDFEQRLPEAQQRALRSGQNLALLFVDLDGFKSVNDQHGHATGDQLLIEVAKRLRDCVRLTDTVNRLGGDEFTVTLEGAGGHESVAGLCERIVESLSKPYQLGAHRVISTPSIGAAILEEGEPLDAFQHRADSAMYEAKRAGKGRFLFAAGTPAAACA